MTASSDMRYGRRGGRVVAPEPAKKPDPVYRPEPPGPEALTKHLIADHRLSSWVIADHTTTEHLVWHTAEHRHSQTILTHHHTLVEATPATADDEMAGYLRQAIAGKLPAPQIEKFVARADMAGRRRADGLGLSPFDEQCMEIAAAVATRAAKKAKRRAA